MSRENSGLAISMMMWRIHNTAHITEIYGQENQDDCERVSRKSQDAVGAEIRTMDTDVEKSGCDTKMALTK